MDDFVDVKNNFSLKFPTCIVEYFNYISEYEDYDNYNLLFDTIYRVAVEKDALLYVGFPWRIYDGGEQMLIGSINDYLFDSILTFQRKVQLLAMLKYFLYKGVLKMGISTVNYKDFACIPLCEIEKDYIYILCSGIGLSQLSIFAYRVIDEEVIIYPHEDMGFGFVYLKKDTVSGKPFMSIVDKSAADVYWL